MMIPVRDQMKNRCVKKTLTIPKWLNDIAMENKVNLKLWVKVQKNWRDSDYLMKNFGYREDE